MLNKMQFRVLIKIIAQIRDKYPNRNIISNWSLSTFELSADELLTIKTVSLSRVNNQTNTFRGHFGEMINIDSYAFDMINEYKEYHSWYKQINKAVTLISLLVGIAVGVIVTVISLGGI